MDTRDDIRERLGAEVRARGLAPTARDLRMPPSTLSSVVAGTAREGSVMIAAIRMAEREVRLEREAAGK